MNSQWNYSVSAMEDHLFNAICDYNTDLRVAGIVTQCGGQDSHEKQKKCKWYDKASHDSRCMYLKFGKYCDCPKK